MASPFIAQCSRWLKALDEAPKRGWVIVNMADDWKTVFPAKK